MNNILGIFEEKGIIIPESLLRDFDNVLDKKWRKKFETRPDIFNI